MPRPLILRSAKLPDAAAMSQVRRDAIAQLCGPDHHDDPATIDAWVGDTSATKFTRLLEDSSVTLVVATLENEIVGLASYCGDLITLNYVDARYRFQGISKRLMLYLEQQMALAGTTTAHLSSTVTAYRFYRSIGWMENGVETPDQGIPMRKDLLD